MSSLLFDAPIWLLIFLALIGTGVTFTGLQRLQNSMRNAGLAILGVAALLLLLRVVVETDEKRVEKDARALVVSISQQDWPAAGTYLRHAKLYDMDGDKLLRHAKDLSSHYGLTSVAVNSIEVRREPSVMVAIVSVTSQHKNNYIDSVPSTWNFEYQKRQGKWVLTNLVPAKIGMGNTGNPEDIIRMKIK